jgi:hypothetical protein
MAVVPTSLCTGKGKGKFRPRTGHEGSEWEYRYSCTLSLTSPIDGAAGQRHAPFFYVKIWKVIVHVTNQYWQYLRPGKCLGRRNALNLLRGLRNERQVDTRIHLRCQWRVLFVAELSLRMPYLPKRTVSKKMWRLLLERRLPPNQLHTLVYHKKKNQSR